jgi:hypothetical protein
LGLIVRQRTMQARMQETRPKPRRGQLKVLRSCSGESFGRTLNWKRDSQSVTTSESLEIALAALVLAASSQVLLCVEI